MSKHPEQEGVIQYHCQLQPREHLWPQALLQELNTWRSKMLLQGWIGQDPQRYQGLGFGNLSLRYPVAQAADAFIITASQSGQLTQLTSQHWPLVLKADIENNLLLAEGAQPPSSEAMTHAAIYQSLPTAQAVIHIHSPELWKINRSQPQEVTPKSLRYGTPALARAIAERATARTGVITLLGHEDGLLAWGASLEEAAEALFKLKESTGINSAR